MNDVSSLSHSKPLPFGPVLYLFGISITSFQLLANDGDHEIVVA